MNYPEAELRGILLIKGIDCIKKKWLTEKTGSIASLFEGKTRLLRKYYGNETPFFSITPHNF
jgi:hypothetical protein